jgi:hypothetical protein
MDSVPLLRRSSAGRNRFEKHCFCEAVAHCGEKCGLTVHPRPPRNLRLTGRGCRHLANLSKQTARTLRSGCSLCKSYNAPCWISGKRDFTKPYVATGYAMPVSCQTFASQGRKRAGNARKSRNEKSPGVPARAQSSAVLDRPRKKLPRASRGPSWHDVVRHGGCPGSRSR